MSSDGGVRRFFEDVSVGDELAPLHKQINLPRMMAYGAATWDFIRVHYDADHVRELGFPGPFVDGQMLGAFLAQHVQDWAGPGAFLRKLGFRNRVMAYPWRLPGLPWCGHRAVPRRRRQRWAWAGRMRPVDREPAGRARGRTCQRAGATPPAVLFRATQMSKGVEAGMIPPSALNGVKVVEYTEAASASLCARLLGDAGADVVKVEPPEGDRHRRHGPFPDGHPDPDWSGMFLYLNANKRGVGLEPQVPPQAPSERSGVGRQERSGRKEAFNKLLAKADVLVVGGQSADIERQGLRRETLKHLNPGLIIAAITPFGLSGPNSGYMGDDLTAVAAGGLSFSTPGVPDGVQDPAREPPLTANTPLAELMTGVLGSAACVAALLARQFSGQGCEIDLSLQEGVAAVMPYELAHAAYHEAKTRQPPGFALMPNVYMPCKDGYVVIMAVLDGHWRRLMEAAGSPDWGDLEVFATGQKRGENWDALEPLMLEWTMSHTGEEIARLGPGARRPLFSGLHCGSDDGITPRCPARLSPRLHQPRRAELQAARTPHPHERDALAVLPARAPPGPAHSGGSARLARLAGWRSTGPVRGVPGAGRREGCPNPLS